MRVGYLHLIGGASGDMLLGAILDAGLPLPKLETELEKLPVSGYRLRTEATQRRGVHGTRVTVDVGKDERHWGWAGFIAAIQESALSAEVKGEALKVFGRLEEAESRAHRVSVGEASSHLDELGSLDTLIDVVGVVVGLHLLGVEKLCASLLPMGSGVMQTGHGSLPAAAPATLELVAMARAPVVAPPPGVVGELVTPTGAALITTLAEFQQPTLRLERVGYGLGTRDPEGLPNALALWLGELEEADSEEGLVLLETNIDDMTPQLFGYVQERLLSLGALDVWFTPIQMKKNRPGVLLSLLLPASLEKAAVNLLFQETSTLGVRTRSVRRHEARREIREVETSLGRLPVKVKYLEGRTIAVAPEYEACRALALERSIPLREVLHRVEEEARAQLLSAKVEVEGP